MSLNADQQAALRIAARASQASRDALGLKDCHALAAILSVGRTRSSALEIGNGTILDTIGLADGSALLDAIHSQPAYKYVIPLLEQGRLKIGSAVVEDALPDLVAAGVLSQLNADKLRALGVEADPLSPQDVADALFNPDGSEK